MPPDIFAIDKAIKYKALLVNNMQKHPIKVLYDNNLKSSCFDYVNFSNNSNIDTFINKAAKCHIDSFEKIREDIKTLSIETDGIHKNYYSLVQNSSLKNSKFTNLRQNNMIMRLNVYNINTFQKLHEEKLQRRYQTLVLDTYQIYSVYPQDWKRILNNTRRIHAPVTDQVNIGLNKWIDRDKVSLKVLTSLFTNKDNSVNINQVLEKKHQGLNVELIKSNPFTNIRNIKDVKIRNLQYKMLHNIYPTMAHLKRWKIKENENCNHCNEKETFRHAVYDCPIAKAALKHVENEVFYRYENNFNRVELSLEDITVGVRSTGSFGHLRREQVISLDIILILLKQRLILQRENKLMLERKDITFMFEERKRLDRYNIMKYKKQYRDLEVVWGKSSNYHN